MKKVLLTSVIASMIAPTVMMGAAVCNPYTINYALQAGDASGSIVKTQTCSGNVQSGQYSISSVITASKGFFSKTINQSASGTYTSPNTIVAQTYTSSDDDTPFPAGSLDTLSLVLFLSSSLSANITTFQPLSVFYKGNAVMLQCSVTNANGSIANGTGATVSGTLVTCSAADNSLVLNYAFSPTDFSMLSVSSVENGNQVLSAVINQ